MVVHFNIWNQSKAIKNSEFTTIHLWPYSDPTIVQQKPQSQAGEFLTCIYQHPRRCVYMYPLVFFKFCFYHRCILNTFTMLSTWFSGCHRLPRDWRTIWRQSGSLWSRGVVTSEVWKLKVEQDSGKWHKCSIYIRAWWTLRRNPELPQHDCMVSSLTKSFNRFTVKGEFD